MTREKIVEIIRQTGIEIVHHAMSGSSGEPAIGYNAACISADLILAALEDEKKGEVVLGEGCLSEVIDSLYYKAGCGGMFPVSDISEGQLIFRPTGKGE